MNAIDEWIDSEGAERDALKFKNLCYISGRRCGKTELTRRLTNQILNSTYGLLVADTWAQRYKEITDTCYKTLGIDEWIDSEYAARYAAEYYGIWETKEKEKQTMEYQKQEHTFVIKNTSGNNYEIIIEKNFNKGDCPYRVSVYYVKDPGEKIFFKSFEYRYWDHVETQLMFDLGQVGFIIRKDYRDNVTYELKRAREKFGGYAGSFNDWNFLHRESRNIRDKANKIINGLYEEPFKAMPKIKKVIFNPPATIVQWKDGTKTIVKCQDDDEFDWEKGLAMAYVKRAFNNDRTYYGLFKKNEPDVILPNSNMRYDTKVAKEVRIIVPKDLPVTGDIIQKAFNLIIKECNKKIENGIELGN